MKPECTSHCECPKKKIQTSIDALRKQVSDLEYEIRKDNLLGAFATTKAIIARMENIERIIEELLYG